MKQTLQICSPSRFSTGHAKAVVGPEHFANTQVFETKKKGAAATSGQLVFLMPKQTAVGLSLLVPVREGARRKFPLPSCVDQVLEIPIQRDTNLLCNAAQTLSS